MIFDKTFCPGSKTLREPMPEDYPCQQCGYKEVEIWTHELKGTCPKCGAPVFKERTPSCIDWCQHAKECVGEETFDRLMEGKE